MKTKKKVNRTRSAKKDLPVRKAGGVKGGFIIEGGRVDKPGETQGVIAIIKPGGGTR